MSQPVKLSELFHDLPVEVLSTVGDAVISGIASDSRQVQAGDLFVALKGYHFDAHRFIPEVVRRGAAAVVGTQPALQPGVPYVQVSDTRRALPYLSAAFYRYPARQLTMIGVTGTDGKTTTVNLIYHILHAAGIRAGMISTVNAVIGGEVLDTGFHVTTPEAQDVQRYLAMMVEAGLTHAVLETTSHGWAQHRVDACEFDIGVVTNITHEHLDEHGSYENYRLAKSRLFTSLAETLVKKQGNPRLSVLNHDDISYEFLAQAAGIPQVSYGLSTHADLRASLLEHRPEGMDFTVQGADLKFRVHSNLTGDFNISNCLAAVTATRYGLGIEPEAIQRGIASLEGVPGRMERIYLGQDFIAIVDFAHTPNALRCTLQAARQMTKGRVIAVFGSAGLRDRQKRRMMAETSAELADLTVLTAEDPRTESLEAILTEMAEGMLAKGCIEGQDFWRAPDRGEAIRLAVNKAQAGDIVMVCGKGHEQSMCFGNIEYPWDDRTALRAALAERLGCSGPGMPDLPTRP